MQWYTAVLDIGLCLSAHGDDRVGVGIDPDMDFLYYKG